MIQICMSYDVTLFISFVVNMQKVNSANFQLHILMNYQPY